MSKIDYVFNNFAGHVTSGLSDFIPAAYGACKRAGATVLVIQLFPESEMSDLCSTDEELSVVVPRLREKFVEILRKHSAMPLDRIASLVIDTNFMLDEPRVQEHRQKMAACQVSYGYDAIYRCIISLRLSRYAEVLLQKNRSGPPKHWLPGQSLVKELSRTYLASGTGRTVTQYNP